MSDFFNTTRVAAKAFVGDFTFKPYCDLDFHLSAFASFFSHVARMLLNLVLTLYRILTILSSILIPIFWLGLPAQAIELADNVGGALIAAATVLVIPAIIVIRTLSSMIFGYEDDPDAPSYFADTLAPFIETQSPAA